MKYRGMAHKFGEMIGFLLIVAFAVAFVSLSVAITYWSLSWAFGYR